MRTPARSGGATARRHETRGASVHHRRLEWESRSASRARSPTPGTKIDLGYRTEKHLEEALAYFAPAGERVHAICVDVTDGVAPQLPWAAQARQ
jgi:hypothetical protein